MCMRQMLRATTCGVAALLLSGCAGMFNDGPFGFLRTEQEVATAAPMERGKTHFATRQYARALEAFRDALAEDPESTRALNAVAATFDQLGRYDLAEKYYQRALAIDPQSIETLNNLGYSHYLRGEADQARKYLALAVLLGGDDPTLHANLARAEQMAEAPPSEDSVPVAAAPAAADAAATQRASLLNVSLTTVSAADLEFGRAAPTLVSTPRVQLVRVSRGVQDLITLGMPLQATPVAEAPLGLAMAAPAAFATEAPPPAVPLVPVSLAAEQPVTVEVANGTGRGDMAARFRAYLVGKGVTVAALADGEVGVAESLVTYREGWAKRAAELARLLPIPVRMERAGSAQQSDIRLLVGADMLPFEGDLMEAGR